MQSHGVLLPLRGPSSSLTLSRHLRRQLPPTSFHSSKTPTRPRSLLLPVASAAFTVSDGELETRGFRVRRSTDGLDVAALNDVFTRVGFPRRDPDRLRRALDHGGGGAVVWVEEAKRGGRPGKPVAFARATGDGVFNAVVWDVVVEPSLQGMGLGRAVMERIVAELRRKGVSNIALYAEPRVVGFYRPLGFATDPDGIRGMVYSRRNQKKR
ncbi:Acetyltransferase (GNAT) family [Musa troglodytarum]|uniref:Acetyltransferase (GNAT) family n=1 Tax=Musa troglodytarum TaxID=320322 RepID=A0A9E7EYN8_9LILI|nr:Acetyltransferase (GNAT) family [Musa troglodytarum]URD86365.1 Acetyltransferase (GNAT) family [Musa troglodytarum]URD86366.1 Acetyltransferase (GNAT) family [Musa troglodytarum]